MTRGAPTVCVVTTIAEPASALDAALDREGIHVVRVAAPVAEIGDAHLARFAGLLDEHAVDVVHLCHRGYGPTPLEILVAAWRAGRRVVLTVVDDWPDGGGDDARTARAAACCDLVSSPSPRVAALPPPAWSARRVVHLPDADAMAVTRGPVAPGGLGAAREALRHGLDGDDDGARWAGIYRGLAGDSDPPVTSEVISVVVTTYGRPRELAACLEGFTRQTLAPGNFEVIVVDDHSPEPAEPVVAAFDGRLPVTHVRHEVNLGLGEARNTGVRRARGRVVLLFDDDDVPGPRLLAEHLRSHLAHPEETTAVLGFTAVAPEAQLDPVLHHVTMVGQQYYSYPPLPEGRPLPWHCAWGGRTSYKTSLLRRHPFRARWLEDTDLNWRLRREGLTVLLNRNAVQFLTAGTTVEEYARRSRNLGAAAARLLGMDPDPELATFLGVTDAAGRAALLDARREELAGAAGREELAGTVGPDRGDLWHELLRLRFEAERLRGFASEAAAHIGATTEFVLVAPTDALPGVTRAYLSAFTQADTTVLRVIVEEAGGADGVVAELQRVITDAGFDPASTADIAVDVTAGRPWTPAPGAFWFGTDDAARPPSVTPIACGSTPEELRRLAGLSPVARDLRAGAAVPVSV